MKTALIIGIILVVAGFAATAWARHGGACSIEDRMTHMQDRIAQKLSLDDTQKGKLTQLGERLKTLRESRKTTRDTARNEALALLDQPVLDRGKAVELFESRKQTFTESAREMIDAFADFSDSLNAEQRTKLKEMVEKRMGHGFGHWRHAPMIEG